MDTRRDVFQAIADPTRRQIIHLISKESMNLNEIANQFDVSRQAISVHVRILTECGLVVIKQKGRERYCDAKLEKINEVYSWAEQYRSFWESRFNSLDKFLAKVQKKKKRAAKK